MCTDPEDTYEYLEVILRRTEFLLKCSLFYTCYDVLQDALRKIDPSTKGYFSLYDMLGTLYCVGNDDNPYYDLQKATEMYQAMFDAYYKDPVDEKLDEHVCYELIIIHVRNRKSDKAIELCREALEKNPDFKLIQQLLDFLTEPSD